MSSKDTDQIVIWILGGIVIIVFFYNNISYIQPL